MIRTIVKEIIGFHCAQKIIYFTHQGTTMGSLSEELCNSKKLSKIEAYSRMFTMFRRNWCTIIYVQSLNVVGDTRKSLWSALCNESFEKWCYLKYQGSDVKHFKTPSPKMISSTTETLYLHRNGYGQQNSTITIPILMMFLK